MKQGKYSCPKCGHSQYETGELYMAGSFWMKIFNIQNIKYTSISCRKCTFTELYKTDLKRIGNVLDFFIG